MGTYCRKHGIIYCSDINTVLLLVGLLMRMRLDDTEQTISNCGCRPEIADVTRSHWSDAAFHIQDLVTSVKYQPDFMY